MAHFQGREAYRKAQELEEARKAGLAPAALDEDGKEINPHIPQYMAAAPWYLNNNKPVRGRRWRTNPMALCTPPDAFTLLAPQSLKHQRNWKGGDAAPVEWYDRGAVVFQANKYRKGACEKCVSPAHLRESRLVTDTLTPVPPLPAAEP